MRLIKYGHDGKFHFIQNLLGGDIPSYAILSHTWGRDTDEVTYRDLVDETGKGKAGFWKISFCAEQARRDGLQYIWVDTCCIDRSNNVELSEEMGSLFHRYRDASRCYVLLSDVSISGGQKNSGQSEIQWESDFRAARWFTRGWTLLDLLAPASVEFFSREGRRLGDKRSLEPQIHEITGIAIPALRGSPLSQFGVDERFKWAETRQTTREEDWVYCLLGIFDVSMPLIYGEGRENAIRRLRREIDGALSHNSLSRSIVDVEPQNRKSQAEPGVNDKGD